jgi:4-hydroxy-tetrahydrodipicolinate synthase
MPTPEPLFRGVGVALITLFHAQGALDVAATTAHAARVVGRGVRAVLLAGTTGEFWALSETDRVELIQAVRSALPSGTSVELGPGTATLAGQVA